MNDMNTRKGNIYKGVAKKALLKTIMQITIEIIIGNLFLFGIFYFNNQESVQIKEILTIMAIAEIPIIAIIGVILGYPLFKFNMEEEKRKKIVETSETKEQ